MEHQEQAQHTPQPAHTAKPFWQEQFLALSVLFAALIMAGALIYSAQASYALSAKIAALPITGAVVVATPVPSILATATPAATAAPSEPAVAQSPSLEGVNYRGTGDIVMVEYSDFQCPYCGRAEPTVEQIVEQDYKGKVKLVYKHFPLSFHENAQKAAEAYECAKKQNVDYMWQLHDIMYENSDSLAVTNILTLAKGITGLNATALGACINSGETASLVDADLQEGMAVGVEGTPAFFLAKLDSSGKPIGKWQSVVGAQPISAFKTVIDKLLAG